MTIMKESVPVLEAAGLVLRRSSGPEVKTVLDGASLALSRGSHVLLQGSSGSGKSTLLWALARMLPLEAGELSLEGRPAANWPPPLWRERAALVLQKHAMIEGTVRDNLLLPWKLKVRRGREHDRSTPPADTVLRGELDGLELADVDLAADASRLSMGQTARVSLIRTLLTAPGCLLLDEPCAALDPGASERVLGRIRAFTEAGGAVVMAGHGGSARGGRVVVLEKGRLLEDAQ